ncbi:DMT family transporter [Lentilactobacillus kribbianus]|uniref:DMT family transporter n=1 Tax=Lentilactobacillus kribbianus TaxID=2729622 RepID=UPI0015580EEE|nr:multidrug efflux SMR transporter [Lentilactobacillus kribbianus]
MNWIYLIIAGVFEVVWAATMKLSQGFSHLGYGIATLIGLVLSFVFLTLATRSLPLSIAYPVWTGIGAVGSIIAGVVLFHDQLPPVTWIFVVLLIVGLIGIKVTSGH